MMDYLDEIAAFRAVITWGGFGAAAKALKTEKSTISRRVQALEERVRAPLLFRTTRKMVLTKTGERFYESIDSALEQIEASYKGLLNHSIQGFSGSLGLQGTVRITAPVVLGQTLLAPVVVELQEKFPNIAYEFVLDDKVLDLTSDRIDIAIRAGRVSLQGAKAIRLGSTLFKLYASKSYLVAKRAAPILSPSDLSGHRCLVYVPAHEDFAWHLVSGSERYKVRFNLTVRANTLSYLMELCKAGLGIALLPTDLADASARAGELTEVLPAWSAENSTFSLVIPQGRMVTDAVKASAEFLVKRLRRDKST